MAVSCSNEFDDAHSTQEIIGKWKVKTSEIKITNKGKVTTDITRSYSNDTLSQYWTFTADSVLYETNFGNNIPNDTCTYFIQNGTLQFRNKYIRPPMTIKSITHTSLVLYMLISTNETEIYSNENFLTLEKQ
jgi:hypothetical protein